MRRLLIGLVLVAALALPASSLAELIRIDRTDVTITNPCNGEEVLVSGYEQLDPSNPRSASTVHLTGTGLQSGVKYFFLRMSMHVIPDGEGAQQHHRMSTWRIISADGSVPNWIMVSSSISMTLPDGTPVNNFTEQTACVGGEAPE